MYTTPWGAGIGRLRWKPSKFPTHEPDPDNAGGGKREVDSSIIHSLIPSQPDLVDKEIP